MAGSGLAHSLNDTAEIVRIREDNDFLVLRPQPKQLDFVLTDPSFCLVFRISLLLESIGTVAI